MDFKQTEFEQADRRYTDLVRQRDAGGISQQEFEAQRQRLTVLDGEGRWWGKSADGGEWQYHDGSAWIRGTPPPYQGTAPNPTAGPVADGARQRPPATGGRKKRRAWPWVLAAIAVVGLAGIGFLAWAFLPGAVPGLPGSGVDAAFVHRATADNVSEDNTYIDHELANENPDAILYVTQHWNPDRKKAEEGVYNGQPVGVWYDPQQKRWAIFNVNREPMPEGAGFNVAILSKPSE